MKVGQISGWIWWAAFGAVVLLLLWPLTVVDVPPILDYPNHLARLYVLAHPDDSVLARFYEQQWSIVPNLAIDVLAPPLLRLLPVHVAGRIVIGVTLLLPVIGCVVYSRAVFGRRTLWPLGAALIAYNAVFILGFLNFQITLGLALLLAAGWHAWSHRWPGIAALAGAVGATGLFFSHIFGLAFFAVLCAADELAGLRSARRSGTPLLPHAAHRGVMLAAVFCVPTILYLRAPLGLTGGGLAWRPWVGKLYVAFSPFAHYRLDVTFLTAGAVLTAIVLLVPRGRLRAGPATATAMIVLSLSYVVLPAVTPEAAFIDTRIPIMVALLMFAGLAPIAVPRTLGAVVATILALALILRAEATTAVWRQQTHDVTALRSVIGPVEPGAKVLLVGIGQDMNPQYWAAAPDNRVLPGYMQLNAHLTALLLIEHKAFWPLLFTAHDKQPLVVRPPYDRISTAQGWIPSLSQLADPSIIKPENDTKYLDGWRNAFDYVLLLDPLASGDPRTIMPKWLELLTSNDVAALYRVRGHIPDNRNDDR
ncbi:MAG: hypothetical protein P4L90_25280 [Rhodopila sp.]|nr:hypothetical protein [Rhodopila sp.]